MVRFQIKSINSNFADPLSCYWKIHHKPSRDKSPSGQISQSLKKKTIPFNYLFWKVTSHWKRTNNYHQSKVVLRMNDQKTVDFLGTSGNLLAGCYDSSRSSSPPCVWPAYRLKVQADLAVGGKLNKNNQAIFNRINCLTKFQKFYGFQSVPLLLHLCSWRSMCPFYEGQREEEVGQ